MLFFKIGTKKSEKEKISWLISKKKHSNLLKLNDEAILNNFFVQTKKTLKQTRLIFKKNIHKSLTIRNNVFEGSENRQMLNHFLSSLKRFRSLFFLNSAIIVAISAFFKLVYKTFFYISENYWSSFPQYTKNE